MPIDEKTRIKIKCEIRALCNVVLARLTPAMDREDFGVIAKQLRQALRIAEKHGPQKTAHTKWKDALYAAHKAAHATRQKPQRMEYDVRLIDKHGDCVDVHGWPTLEHAERDFADIKIAGDVNDSEHRDNDDIVAVVLEKHDHKEDTYTLVKSRGSKKALEEGGWNFQRAVKGANA